MGDARERASAETDRFPPPAASLSTHPPTSPSQVYNVTSGKSLPQWLSEKRKRSLRKDEEYR